MSKHATPPRTTGEQHDEQTRDCDRCGRDRPASPQRFTITASDETGGYERAFLCGECWQEFRDEIRRCLA